MFRRVAVSILLFIMVHGIVYTALSQCKGIQMIIEIVEEETNHSENTSKLNENSLEFLYQDHAGFFYFQVEKKFPYTEKFDYYKQHYKTIPVKSLLDNPPEV